MAPLLGLALLFSATPGVAQTDAPAANGGEPRFYGGARLLFSNANVKSATEYDPRFGLGGGVYVGGSAWKDFDVRIEANYVQKGANLTYSTWSLEWQLDYIDVPVLLVYNVSPRSRTSVEFYGGAAYSYGVHLQAEEGDNLGYDLEDVIGQPIPLVHSEVLVDGEPVPRTSLIVNSVESSEWSYVFGIGLSVPVGAVNLTFDARYTGAISSPSVSGEIQDVEGDGAEATLVTSSADVTNKVFCWYVGFEFPFGTRAASQ